MDCGRFGPQRWRLYDAHEANPSEANKEDIRSLAVEAGVVVLPVPAVSRAVRREDGEEAHQASLTRSNESRRPAMRVALSLLLLLLVSPVMAGKTDVRCTVKTSAAVSRGKVKFLEKGKVVRVTGVVEEKGR